MSYRTDIPAFLLADHCSVIPWVLVLLNTRDGQKQQFLCLEGLFRLKEGSHSFPAAHYDDCKPAIDGNGAEAAAGQRFHSSTNPPRRKSTQTLPAAQQRVYVCLCRSVASSWIEKEESMWNELTANSPKQKTKQNSRHQMQNTNIDDLQLFCSTYLSCQFCKES